MNILLAANESAGIQALQLIKNSGHHITGVITETNSSNRIANVASVAKSMGLPVYPASTVMEPAFSKIMKHENTDILLNIYLLKLIDQALLWSVNIGAFNLHPGPLPQYAGLNTPSWAIYNQEHKYAVTLHWITPGLDEGPIAFEEYFSISDKETGLSLNIKCVEKGIHQLEKLLNNCEKNPKAIPVIKQSKKQRRLYKRNEKPNGGYIKWTESAAKIDAQVRACNFSPFHSPLEHPAAYVHGQKVEIFKTFISHMPANGAEGTISLIENRLAVACSDEWLFIDQVKANGIVLEWQDLLRCKTFETRVDRS